ncbi:MAG: hypothetical protein HWE37_04095 [Rhodobacteraceae bacterium]|uniref:NADH dehydrogenase subunit E n=1 Tax=Salipiger thiooxidans TaxID=282683 RepID=A0A1G7DHM7_9RHOB|nr:MULTISPECIES: hypothetical protein [Salipiger]NIY99781.1 hypothetical protein [Salipiger sp. HF18]NVK59234.1 hypothetical protein [Paracoccaceae bacterium]SDE50959.1 hypothetical protein SAMN04488105_104229 [Salipiger thiooxidans]
MLKNCLAVLPLVATAGCLALPPKGVEDQQMLAFDDAVDSIGCALDYEADYLAVELQTGLTREQIQQVANYRIAGGNGERTETGGFRLTSGACTPVAEPAAPVADATGDMATAG